METTGDLRRELAKCFALSRDGKLSGDGLRGVIGCANQINISISTEIKARAQLQKEGEATTALGSMKLSTE